MEARPRVPARETPKKHGGSTMVLVVFGGDLIYCYYVQRQAIWRVRIGPAFAESNLRSKAHFLGHEPCVKHYQIRRRAVQSWTGQKEAKIDTGMRTRGPGGGDGRVLSRVSTVGRFTDNGVDSDKGQRSSNDLLDESWGRGNRVNPRRLGLVSFPAGLAIVHREKLELER
jgi:hypothetical protein